MMTVLLPSLVICTRWCQMLRVHKANRELASSDTAAPNTCLGSSKPTYLCLSKGSTPTVGSSRISSSGSCMRATAKDTRLCWPPLQSTEKSDPKPGRSHSFLSAACSCRCSPEVLDQAVLGGEVEEVKQEVQPLLNLAAGHAEDPPKVHHGFPYRELAE